MPAPQVILISKHYVFDTEEWLEHFAPNEEEKEALNNGDVEELVEYYLEAITQYDAIEDTVSVEKLGEMNV